jgi:hypothetical protein
MPEQGTKDNQCGSGGVCAVAPRLTPWMLLYKLYCSTYLAFFNVGAGLNGVLIQFVSQVLNLMVIQIEVCQRFVCVVSVNWRQVCCAVKSKSKSLRWKSPACIKEKLPTSAHTSQSPTENAVLWFCFLTLRIRPSVFTSSHNSNSFRWTATGLDSVFCL